MINGDDASISGNVGQVCSGGYGDLTPGEAVLVTDGASRAVATTSLGGGTVVAEIRNTAAEHSEREDLIDSIYDLRIAMADSDPVAVALVIQ